MYVLTSRWIVPDLEVAKVTTKVAKQWFKAAGVENVSALIIATGEHVGQMQFVVRYADEAAYAQIAPRWRASSEYADIMAKAKASGAKMMDQVHYREL
ncbi:MAG: hypothetical protein HYX38_15260 [Rhodospirillales bacterium]|nr:hypothetical protein [Rhodospirillales bacterium]